MDWDVLDLFHSPSDLLHCLAIHGMTEKFHGIVSSFDLGHICQRAEKPHMEELMTERSDCSLHQTYLSTSNTIAVHKETD